MRRREEEEGRGERVSRQGDEAMDRELAWCNAILWPEMSCMVCVLVRTRVRCVNVGTCKICGCVRYVNKVRV